MSASGSAAYQVDDERKLIICPDGRVVRNKSPRGFELLVFLHKHPGRVFSRVELLELVWGSIRYNADNVNMQVRRLRQEVGPDVIDNLRGHGYGVGITG